MQHKGGILAGKGADDGTPRRCYKLAMTAANKGASLCKIDTRGSLLY
jgi:hypothetical protein